MATQTPNQLSHDEALELLPWHINSTLEDPLSEMVAQHVERCSTCQEEAAILSNTIIALNTGDAENASLDGRFANLLGRVREFEQSKHTAGQRDGQSFGQRVAEWLDLSQRRMQWAGAFALGLAVGIGALLVTMQSTDVDPSLGTNYQTHASSSMPMRLQVQLDQAPDAELLARLEQAAGSTAQWQQQSDVRFLIELPDETTVKTVADIKSRLLAVDSVVTVVIDVNNDGEKSE